MLKSLRLLHRFSVSKASIGFQALYNQDLKTEVEQHSNPKLDALVEVILSLNNR